MNLGMLRFPGLEASARYRVEVIDRTMVPPSHQVPWLNSPERLELTGAQLMDVGLRAPVLRPSSAVLFDIVRI